MISTLFLAFPIVQKILCVTKGKIWNRQIPQGCLKCSFSHIATSKTGGFHHFRPVFEEKRCVGMIFPCAPMVGANVPMVRANAPMVGTRVPMVGACVPTVGTRVPMVGTRVPMVGACVPTVGACVPMVGACVRMILPCVKIILTHRIIVGARRKMVPPSGGMLCRPDGMPTAQAAVF